MDEFNKFVLHVKAVSGKRFNHSNLKHIFVSLKLIDVGLKPSYLWDRSPFLPADDIRRLVVSLNLEKITEHILTVFTLNEDIFIANREVLLGVLAEPLEYFTFFNANSLETMSNEEVNVCGIVTCLEEFRSELQLFDGRNVLVLTAFNGWSLPCIYGVALGYPTVLWLPPDANKHSLDATPLTNCKLKISYPGVTRDEELFSFSHLPNEILTSHVDQWFSTLKNKFEHLIAFSLERNCVTSSTVTL